MKQARRILIGVSISAFLFNVCSCAWMFHGTSDEIHIQSLDSKAELYVNDQPVGIGSATTTVERDKTYTIEARQPGCETRTEQTGDKFDGVSLLGILLDAGIISILVVDMGVTGAAWKTYPLTYTVTPICPTVEPAVATSAPAAAATTAPAATATTPLVVPAATRSFDLQK